MKLTTKAKTDELKMLNFEDAFRPIYRFSWAVGLWPFTIVHHSNGTIQNARISRFDGFWVLISMCFQLSAILYTSLNIVDHRNNMHGAPFIFPILFAMHQVTLLSIGVIGTLMDMYNRQRLANILGNFIIFDNEVSSMNSLLFVHNC